MRQLTVTSSEALAPEGLSYRRWKVSPTLCASCSRSPQGDSTAWRQ